MIKKMELVKNIITMETKNLKEYIKKEKKMEMERNIMMIKV